MTTYAYYPGCSLHGTSREYDHSSRSVCQALGLELREVEDWNCCGASSGHMTNRWLGLALPARNLRQIEQMGLDKVTVPCSACYERLREASHDLKDEATWRRMAEEVGVKVEGKVAIEHLADTLSQPEMLPKISALVTKPLAGLKVACYYGCLMTRPPEIVAFDDVENPQRLDTLMRLAGAEPVQWPAKTECCGGALMLGRSDVVVDLVGHLLDMATEMGAEAIVAACPLCQANIDMREAEVNAKFGKKYDIPIYFFTQLLGLSFGQSARQLMVEKHLVNGLPLLQSKGLA